MYLKVFCLYYASSEILFLARRINVIMPFLYESRQHKRTSRESLDCAMALQELTKMGVSNIITFDAHDARVQNAIPRDGFESVPCVYQFIKALLRAEPDLQVDNEHLWSSAQMRAAWAVQSS